MQARVRALVADRGAWQWSRSQTNGTGSPPPPLPPCSRHDFIGRRDDAPTSVAGQCTSTLRDVTTTLLGATFMSIYARRPVVRGV